MTAWILLTLFLQTKAPLFENAYMIVHKNEAPCADAALRCGDRVIVALGDVDLQGKILKRGDIAVFEATRSYTAPHGGPYLEVAIKPSHPPVKGPDVQIPPDKNTRLYDGKDFFVFEEKLDPGDTRPRHGHAQRLAIILNATRLQQWPDGQPESTKDEIPDDVHFNEAVVHAIKNVGTAPLRNIVIELKPSASRGIID